MKKNGIPIVALLLTLSILGLGFQQDTASENAPISERELALYDLINQYRSSKKLSEIPLSPALTLVAASHCQDLNDHYRTSKRCNLHSWSKNGKWSSCCYTPNHKQASCMWDKPRELTDYQGDGFEIAFAKYRSDQSNPQITAQQAFNSWKKSKGHNSVMVNKGNFKDVEWNAIGICISGEYACVWFGMEKDPTASE